MIISSPNDFRAAAKSKLPPFLFHYIDGGANSETTLRRNVSDLEPSPSSSACSKTCKTFH